jgi:hypothetical protein
MIKRTFGILMMAVTLLAGITVLAQNNNRSTSMQGTKMGSHKRRHHRRWHRRWHRRGGAMNKNANKH